MCLFYCLFVFIIHFLYAVSGQRCVLREIHKRQTGFYVCIFARILLILHVWLYFWMKYYLPFIFATPNNFVIQYNTIRFVCLCACTIIQFKCDKSSECLNRCRTLFINIRKKGGHRRRMHSPLQCEEANRLNNKIISIRKCKDNVSFPIVSFKFNNECISC